VTHDHGHHHHHHPEPAVPGAPPVIGLRRRSPAFEVLRGQAKIWLRAHQPALAKRTEGCQSVYVDIPRGKVTFGTPLADRFEAGIIAVAGVWVPSTGQFSLTLLDETCPPELTERLKWCASREPLASLPEMSLPLWEQADEDDAWVMAALLGEGCAAAGVQAAGSPGGLAFLLIEEIASVPLARRKLTPESVLSRRAFLAQPAVDALSVVLARDPVQAMTDDAHKSPGTESSNGVRDNDDSVDFLKQALTVCEDLVARMNECAGELAASSDPAIAAMSREFAEPAADLERSLESVAAAFEAASAPDVAASLSELCVVLSAMVPEKPE